MHIVIIGNGITGITAALTARKLSEQAAITVISGENPHFYARTGLMYLYLGQLQYQHLKGYEDWFWPEKQITLVHDWVNGIDLTQKTVLLQAGNPIPYTKLLIATGSKTNFPDLAGIKAFGVHGFYNLADLQKIEQATAQSRPAVIVGAGLIGIELAEMLHSRNIKTTLLNRHDRYWGNNLPEPEARLIERTLSENGIAYRPKTTLTGIKTDEQGNVKAVETSDNEELPCGFVGIATGVKPDFRLARENGIKTARGILVNEFLETSAPDVYAAGDCAELTFAGNQVEQLWYTGRLQGEIAGYNLCGKKLQYSRGIPFNSACFFEVEFQSYGLVNPENNPKVGSFYWQHPQKKISLRINFVTGKEPVVCGFVAMGLRLRQSCCETWIKTGTPLISVISELETAFFNEELSASYTKLIQAEFARQYPETKIIKTGRRFFSWI